MATRFEMFVTRNTFYGQLHTRRRIRVVLRMRSPAQRYVSCKVVVFVLIRILSTSSANGRASNTGRFSVALQPSACVFRDSAKTECRLFDSICRHGRGNTANRNNYNCVRSCFFSPVHRCGNVCTRRGNRKTPRKNDKRQTSCFRRGRGRTR